MDWQHCFQVESVALANACRQKNYTNHITVPCFCEALVMFAFLNLLFSRCSSLVKRQRNLNIYMFTCMYSLMLPAQHVCHSINGRTNGRRILVLTVQITGMYYSITKQSVNSVHAWGNVIKEGCERNFVVFTRDMIVLSATVCTFVLGEGKGNIIW